MQWDTDSDDDQADITSHHSENLNRSHIVEPISSFVTSSAYSGVLGMPVALAMLKRGFARIGETVTLYHLGRTLQAEVVKTPFFDPKGGRLEG